MVNNTTNLERIGVKEKPSTWEGLISMMVFYHISLYVLALFLSLL